MPKPKHLAVFGTNFEDLDDEESMLINIIRNLLYPNAYRGLRVEEAVGGARSGRYR
jgi:hypothetical protein